MSLRVVIVPQGSSLLRSSSTKILHTYANGDVLVQTEARVSEADAAQEEPIAQGVQLEGISESDLDEARETLKQPHPTESFQDGITAYIELIGPIDPTWLDRLKSIEIKLLQFQPAFTYLSHGTRKAFQQAASLPFVLNVTPLVPAIKPKPTLPEAGTQSVRIVLHGDRHSALNLIRSLNHPPDVTINLNQDIEQVDFSVHIRATVTADGQEQLLRDSRVLAIEPYTAPQLEDELSGLIIAGQYNTVGQPSGSYLRWLEDHGLNGAGVTIGIVDAGVDTLHLAYRDRIRDLTGDRKSWHGTFVAGHAAGCYLAEKDSNNFIYGLGIAPAAGLLAQDNQKTSTTLCKETVTTPAPSGIFGTVQNNSWGAGTREVMDYGSQEAIYDRLVRNADPEGSTAKPLTICFSSGNSGAAGLTRPKSAKNILVTGNSENYRPDVGRDQSDNIREIYSGPRASSHGNCGDGRIRPHVVIAGEWTASANYDSSAGQKEYISPKLTWGGGSSGASPKTAGACALLIQWWRLNHQGVDPSPAMLRALIVNGAEPIDSGGPIPNKVQGWGRLNLENVLAKTARRIYIDQTELLKQRGDQRQWTIRVADSKQPLKLTLAWTDPPGAIGSGTATAPAIVNKLALRIEINGVTYRSNQFQNGWSYPDGSPEREGWDNLQNIYLPVGMAKGVIRVSVVALDITTNCLTGQILNPQQDFALVMTNAQLDKATTPAAVFIGVDRPAVSSSTTKEFWADKPNSSDAQITNSTWWTPIHQQAGTSTQPPSPQPIADADAWWAAEDAWKKTESDRDTSDYSRLLQALQAGVSIVTGAGHQVVLPNHSGITAEANDLPVVDSITQSLSDTLIGLLAQWNATPTTVRRSAVLVVGAGTRISGGDLDTLRQLSFLGDLFLVSDHGAVLTFLIQRLQRLVGVHVRLASDVLNLPTLLQDTIAEASGAQQVQVASTQTTTVSQHRFQIVAADARVSLRVYFPIASAPKLKIIPPNHPAIALDHPGLQLTKFPDAIQIDLNPQTISAWAGEWIVELPLDQARLRVRVWAWSQLQLTFQEQSHPVSESDRAEADALIAVSNDEGATFNRLQALPRVLGVVTEESDRSVEATIPVSRQDETPASPYAPMISAWVHVPTSTNQSTIADLPLRIEGRDAAGDRFVRLIRHNLIRLQPLSAWRQVIAAAPSILITAQIAEVQLENHQVVGLRLQRGMQQRSVTIVAPILQQQLTRLYGRQRLSVQSVFTFEVVGRDLIAVTRPLPSPHSHHVRSSYSRHQ